MKKLLLAGVGVGIVFAGIIFWINTASDIPSSSTAPDSPTIQIPFGLEKYPDLINWKRPEGPAKVALQVGHWRNSEFPDELERLKNNTGAVWGSIAEPDVNYEIAVRTQQILEARGVRVEILPATVPPSYFADAFISIHADGSENTDKSGFKVSPPRRDYSGKSTLLSDHIEQEYPLITLMEQDPVITRNMTGYYAFSWWRFDHAVHPMTPAAILETGFLTNYSDRLIIVDAPEASAEGLANGVLKFLEAEGLI